MLYEDRLPAGSSIFTPSEILSLLGTAATQGHKNPAGYVVGEYLNARRSDQLQSKRGERYGMEQAEATSPEEQSIKATLWARLPMEARGTLMLALDYPIEVLAQLWGLSYRGAEKRIRVAREALKNISESEA